MISGRRPPHSHVPASNRLPLFAKNGSRQTPFSRGFLTAPSLHPTALPFVAENGNRMESLHRRPIFGRPGEPSRAGLERPPRAITVAVVTSPSQHRSARGANFAPLALLHVSPSKRLPEFAKNGSDNPRFSQGSLNAPSLQSTPLPFFAENGNRPIVLVRSANDPPFVGGFAKGPAARARAGIRCRSALAGASGSENRGRSRSDQGQWDRNSGHAFRQCAGRGIWKSVTGGMNPAVTSPKRFPADRSAAVPQR